MGRQGKRQTHERRNEKSRWRKEEEGLVIEYERLPEEERLFIDGICVMATRVIDGELVCAGRSYATSFARGRCLNIGAGLAVSLNLLSKRKAVKSIETIERFQCVIDFVYQRVRDLPREHTSFIKGSWYHVDTFIEAKAASGFNNYDYIFYDACPSPEARDIKSYPVTDICLLGSLLKERGVLAVYRFYKKPLLSRLDPRLTLIDEREIGPQEIYQIYKRVG